MSDHSRGDDAAHAGSSRRGFLLASGAAAVGAVPTASAERRSPAVEGVTVDGSPTQLGVARRAAERVRRTQRGASVSLETSGTTAGVRRLLAGDVDVAVGSRPVLPAEAERASATGVAYESREVAVEARALITSGSAWYDCLATSRLAERWSAETDVETWAEITPEAVDAGDVESAFDRRAADVRTSTPSRPALVRGVRAQQYATGSGGLGYYEADPVRLVRPSDAEGAADHTPLVRLVYLAVDRESLRRPAVREFVERYSDAGVVANSAYVDDPHLPQ